MNVIKKYFTLKRIVIFFGGIVFLILFFSGGSFQFLNPQYYKFQYLMNTQSGFYILDEKLYRETKIENLDYYLMENILWVSQVMAMKYFISMNNMIFNK